MNESKILSELHPFFYPRAIAVVGVSQNLWKFSSLAFTALQQFGFPGSIYPVSARAKEFMGLQVYPSIATLPEGVDLARICLPAHLVPGAVQECRQKGIPAVEVLSGGFSETGTAEGKRLEAELVRLAGNVTRILGPNCFGVYSPAGGVTHIPGGNYPRESGPIGFFSQSGAITEDFCRLSRDYGLRLSQAISYGNACDIGEVELLQYFNADLHTKVIAAYIEGVKRGRELFNIMRRVASRKPTIVWKGGITPSGARAAMSHTASLAGSERVWAAFFEQTGAIQVNSLEELLDTASAFHHLPAQADPRVALVCGGGGISVVASDCCNRAGLVLPTLGEKVQQKLASILPPIGASTHNPVDCDNPFPPAEILRDILETLATSGEIGSIIIDKVTLSIRMRQLLGYNEQMGWEDKPWISELPVHVRRRFAIPVIVVLREGGDRPGELFCEAERGRLRQYYQEQGIAVYPTIDRALKALGYVINYYQRKHAINNGGK